MNHNSKSLNVLSTLSVIALGAAFVAGCTITTTPSSDAGSAPSTTPPVVTPPGADAGDGGSAISPVVVAAGCSFGEPNDNRDQAKAIDLGTTYTGLCVSNPDHTDELDFFEITAPSSDAAGGVVEVSVSNVKDRGLAEIIVTSAADNVVIFDSYTTDPGASTAGWLSVTPGAKYRVQINRFGGAGDRFTYDLSTKYTAINDTFEPNNKKEDAKAITLNTPIHATSAAHSANGNLQVGDDADWYKVTIAAGTASIKMTNVASDYLCDVQLFDASGEKVAEQYETTKGADCILPATDLKGGSYYVLLNTFGGLPLRGDAHTPVASFMLQQYKLEVQQ
jgi:hypothetical protein